MPPDAQRGPTAWLLLPFPPSVNNLFSQGIVRGKLRRFPSRRYKSWREEACWLIRQARLPRFDQAWTEVQIVLTPVDKRTRDADNYNKAILDALASCNVVADDSHIGRVDTLIDTSRIEVGALVRIALIGEMPAYAVPDRPALSGADRTVLREVLRTGGYIPRNHYRAVPIGVTRLIEKGYLIERTADHYELVSAETADAKTNPLAGKARGSQTSLAGEPTAPGPNKGNACPNKGGARPSA